MCDRKSERGRGRAGDGQRMCVCQCVVGDGVRWHESDAVRWCQLVRGREERAVVSIGEEGGEGGY